MRTLKLTGSVGKRGLNAERDVRIVQERLAEIDGQCRASTGKCDGQTIEDIVRFQKRFLAHPDGLIQMHGMTLKLLERWSTKPVAQGVDLRGSLQTAWDLVNPLLPQGSYCASGYRSPEDQRRILHRFFSDTYKAAIVKKHGLPAWQDAWSKRDQSDEKILSMVRSVGQAIAAPGKSMHQRGKAVDVGGPDSIDVEQVRIIRMVAKANPTVFTGMVLKERNGCVHFEVR